MDKLIKINQAANGLSAHTDDPLEIALSNMSESERRLCAVIHRYNQLRAYPLSQKEILEWKDSFVKLSGKDLAELAEKLDFVIDKMIVGEIDNDPKHGIKNLFEGLKEVQGELGKYKIRSWQP